MNLSQPVSVETIDRLLAGVSKPARYTGGELNSITKDHDVRCRIALCFADVYEIAESHIGYKILYDIINKVERYAAERVYAMWPDLEQHARAQDVPLWSLETRRPLAMFDIVGFTLQYELAYPTMLAMLDHGGVPMRTAHRTAGHPFVIGGGAGAFNPEPIADFFDGLLLGDGEYAIVEIMDVVAAGRQRGASRADILHELARIDGMYVPSHYEISYDGLRTTEITAKPGTPKAGLRTKHGTARITRTTVVDLDAAPYPSKTIVPNVKPVHDRAAVEIQRGCTQACRFCQAGMITRPTRQRRPETVLKIADQLLATSGCDEVSLLSLSVGDYQPINIVLSEFFDRYREDKISVSLPSMRTETMTPQLAEQVATVRKGGFTFAPEAGSERMRNVINKTNTEEDLMNAVRATVRAGWRKLKFYFMIGLPTETDADVAAIAHLAGRARAEGRKIRPDVNVTVSVSTFVPKPHTSFQWEAQLDIAETRRKHNQLRDLLYPQKIQFRYHAPEQSFLEGVLSRGDRRLGAALELAAQRGCRLDAWSEWHDHARWMEVLDSALSEYGVRPESYLHQREESWLLPWDHIDAGILKRFLLRDRKKAYAEVTIEDCAFSGHCYACGGCDLGDPYRAKLRGDDGKHLVDLEPSVFSEIEDERPSALSILGDADAESATAPKKNGTDDPRTHIRFQYAKVGRAFHMSHLDVKEHILRAVRLSRMPVVYSQGFTPRPKVSFSPACPTAVASTAEYFDVTGHGVIEARPWAEAIKDLLPEGLFIVGAERVDSNVAVNDLIVSMTYAVSEPPGLAAAEVRAAVETFRNSDTRPVRVLRKKKPRIMDARAQISDIAMVGDTLHITIDFGDNGTLKIGEAVAAVLGTPWAEHVRIRKTAVDIAETPPARKNTRLDADSVSCEIVDLTAVNVRPRVELPRAAGLQTGTVPYAE